MSIVAWIVIGLVVGVIGKSAIKNNDPGSTVVAILVGMVGAWLGGMLGSLIMSGGLWSLSLWSCLLAIVGAMVLLWIYASSTRPRSGNWDGP